MKIGILGAGYVGLPTGACFAENGNDVVIVEKQTSRLQALQGGRVPIFEPGLQELVTRNQNAERLRFVSDLREVGDRDLYMIAVGTPPLPSGQSDLSQVETAVREIVAATKISTIVILKSTVPVGTTMRMQKLVLEELQRLGKNDLKIELAFNPEFLKQGKAVQDTINPDRIVLGVSSPQAEKVLRRLFKPFSRANDKIMMMDVNSAEMTKYAANCMLSTRISFMNELALLCEACGADIDAIRRGIGADARIGKSFLYAGIGYGGSCFPKDLDALIFQGKEKGLELEILQAVLKRNRQQKVWFFNKIKRGLGGSVRGKTLAIWGLSFKPETDDLRESPALDIMISLAMEGATIRAFDPVAMPNAKAMIEREHSAISSQIRFCADEYEGLDGADALVLLTEWKEFSTPDFADVARRLRGKIVFDGRNQYDAAELAAAGLAYVAVGK